MGRRLKQRTLFKLSLYLHCWLQNKENRDEKSTLLLLWEEIYHFCTTLDDDDVGANACYNCLRTADNAQRMTYPQQLLSLLCTLYSWFRLILIVYFC